jgi:hypothetical protein
MTANDGTEIVRVNLIDGMRRYFARIEQVRLHGQPIGYVSRRRDTKTTRHGWQAWIGEQMTKLVATEDTRDAALAHVIQHANRKRA